MCVCVLVWFTLHQVNPLKTRTYTVYTDAHGEPAGNLDLFVVFFLGRYVCVFFLMYVTSISCQICRVEHVNRK